MAKEGSTVSELVAIMERLLADDGCPWDRAQTMATLRPYLLEETCEVLDAIDRQNPADHCEELGDLLLQIVFQSALAKRAEQFNVDDVVTSICDKLIRRHPHVFASGEANTPEEVAATWDQIKAEEKTGTTGSILDNIPRALPALARAQKISKKAAKVGFDWPDAAGSLDKVKEETREVEASLEESHERRSHEIGDLLFACVNLARWAKVDAEIALREASLRFERRFGYVEAKTAAAGKSLSESSLDEMDALWEEAKAAESADSP